MSVELYTPTRSSPSLTQTICSPHSHIYRPGKSSSIIMAPQEVLNEFFRYVQNDIPLRLIFIPEMKLVDRFAVQEHYLPSIKAITEDDVGERLSPAADVETVVRELVQEVVQYAILSHRWLPQGEPTFKDMVDGTTAGPGREKLWKFCEVANSNRICFAWSDTCCIDKTSSSELDEAIRSMFRWYRNAAVCITYLAQTNGLDDLKSDEWFERGWTLQELLAPPVLKFFNTHWAPLTETTNDKDDGQLLRHLAAATGCSEDQLRNFKPGPHYVDDRMSWAAKRKTTRAEDMAYSLMGIFDVTLQPAYGEGAERAFCRLVEMIMQSNGNTSVLNWAGKAAASHSSMALPSSPRCYLGHPRFNSVRKLDLAMTSRGLRIPLVILPMTLRLIERVGRSNSRVDLSFSDTRFDKETGGTSAEVLGRGYPREVHWALGVFNYMPPYGNQVMGHPALRRTSVAYLLWRRMAPVDQSQLHVEEGLKVQDDLRFYGWKKASTTTFIHFTLGSIERREVMIVSNELLEVVYL
ncbi:hypothetical protein B0T25DRAFT_526564 [Lasiosphaeria hispida]|uniref:Heterokaryon incompatibility domain-containing protein n=1 Tax=Lasiosphaeria hispida TaxID=260671 RepID=A0AAJ0HV09_9PEZI|nr:hypothetical protein B0T25DRAFT_526564 [Lasiosphaeria hispida]